MARKQLKPIPTFRTEDEEREFWATRSSADYVDWSKANWVRFANLKPSSGIVSLSLSKSLLDKIKAEAHKLNVSYQSLIKTKLREIFG